MGALPAISQGAGSQKNPPAAQKPQLAKAPAAQAVQQPYTARYQVTETRTPATDTGSTITRQSTELVARDSQGRRVIATTPVAVPGKPSPVTHVSMSDPIARTNSSWNIPGKQVTVIAMPQPGARTTCPPAQRPAQPPAPRPPSPKPTVEDLGDQTIMGVEVHGLRTTTMIPATAKASEMTRVIEEWTATDPGLRGFFAREITSEPPALTLTRELQSFQKGEPNPAFFQVPPGYEIVNKPAPGTNCPAIQGAPAQFAPIAPPPPA